MALVEHLFAESARGSKEKLTMALKTALGNDGRGILYIDGGNTFWLPG